MRSIESVGKTIEEAVEEGLKKLDLTKADVDIKILSKGGWFSKAKVLITETIENEKATPEKVEQNINVEKKIEDKEKIEKIEPKTSKSVKKSDEHLLIEKDKIASKRILDGDKKEEKPKKEDKIALKTAQTEIKAVKQAEPLTEKQQEEQIEKVKTFLTEFLQKTNIEGIIEVVNTEKAIILEIKTENASLLIGHRGETMQALQTVINSVLKTNNYTRDEKRILIDVENYMSNQVKKLKERTKRAIEKCLQDAKPISMDFMNSYERYIVHEIVVQDGRVMSESFGQDPRRFVKIFIK